jgi:hypothetical protein
MVVGETGTNGFVDLEAATKGIKEKFGRGEGVVLVQLKDSMVETILVDTVKTKDTEVKTKKAFACD